MRACSVTDVLGAWSATCVPRRRALGACLLALRRHAVRQLWRAAVLEEVRRLRAQRVLAAWVVWAAAHAARARHSQLATAGRRRRVLQAALRRWRASASAAALLRRVFSTAAELWRQSLGAAGYEAEFSTLQRCLAGWQLGAAAQREERRGALLEAAAAAFRERRLRAAALAALRRGVEDARELRALLPLRRALFLGWRLAVVASDAHAAAVAARRHAAVSAARAALAAWRVAASTATDR